MTTYITMEDNKDNQEKTGDNKPLRDEKGRLLPGNTANPEGRPKGSFSLVSILKRKLQECPEGVDEKTYAEQLIQTMLDEAIENKNDAQIKNILNYVEGLPKQSVSLGADDTIDSIKIEIYGAENKGEQGVEGEPESNNENSN